jgi:hypothetical protein
MGMMTVSKIGQSKEAIEDEIVKALKHLGADLPAMHMMVESREGLLETLRVLGAKSDLLQFVGSWGDTLKDTDVLYGLKQWNARNARRPATS